MAVEQIAWGGWDNCVRLSNDHVELIATLDVGPRVVYFALKGGENVVYVDEEALGQTGGDEWNMYGGHRLWHAPEDSVRTYVPDNAPVEMTKLSDKSVRLQPALEAATGIQKAITFTLGAGATVHVEHEMQNQGMWDVDLAIWGITVMRTGGTAIIPLPERGEHPRDLLPNTRIISWSYTDFSDPRWTMGYEYILLRQDTERPIPQKIGVELPAGWLGYANGGTLFVKEIAYDASATYPDMGCNAELFTNDWMLEVESLSPMLKLGAGESATHVETWHLFPNVESPQNDEDVKQNILPLVNTMKG